MILYMLSNKVIFLIWLFCALCFEVRFFCRKNERRRGHELSLKSWKQSSDEATPLGPEYAPPTAESNARSLGLDATRSESLRLEPPARGQEDNLWGAPNMGFSKHIPLWKSL